MANPWEGGMKCVFTPLTWPCKGQVAQPELLGKVGLKLVPSFASHHRAPHFVTLAQGIRGRNLNC